MYVDKTAIVKIEGNDSSDKIYYTTDGTDPTQESKLYTAPFTLNKTTVVKAKSFGKNDTESFISEAYFRIVSSNEANGVNVSYFEGKEWNSVPDFRPLSPDKTWKSPEISLDREYIKSLMPEGKSSLGLQFESLLEIDQDGEYTFYLQSDDGSLLYVNDQLVVNNDGDHGGVIEKQGTVKLTKGGRHHIRVGFINVGGGFWIETLYRGPRHSETNYPG